MRDSNRRQACRRLALASRQCLRDGPIEAQSPSSLMPPVFLTLAHGCSFSPAYERSVAATTTIDSDDTVSRKSSPSRSFAT